MKICSKCKLKLSNNNFYKDKSRKDNLQSQCKQCKNDKNYAKNYRKNNRVKLYKQTQLWKIKNRKKYLKQLNNWRNINKGYIKNWKLKNKQHIKHYQKEWNKTNSNYYAEYSKNKRVNDIQFRLASNLRTRLIKSLKDNYKSGSAISDLGCSIEKLKRHLETKFYNHPKTNKQMTWENYGYYGWHIDHIIPLSSFNLTYRTQLLKACHYTNLQPLWAEENLSKGGNNESY